MTDNVIPFPRQLKDDITEQQWKSLQAEFYLDCFLADSGAPATDPRQLEAWLMRAKIKADIESPFFRGWLVRRLSEESTV